MSSNTPKDTQASRIILSFMERFSPVERLLVLMQPNRQNGGLLMLRMQRHPKKERHEKRKDISLQERDKDLEKTQRRNSQHAGDRNGPKQVECRVVGHHYK